VLLPSWRRVGGARPGSDEFCYRLDSAGQLIANVQARLESGTEAVRRPRSPGDRFVAHTLAVTELYVTLVEHSRLDGFTLVDFQAEPTCWWPDGLRGWLKPDALTKVQRERVVDYWWYEADLATESLPTIRRKLRVYLDFVARGRLGPDDTVPRVLIGVPTVARQMAVQSVVNSLPEPASLMFHVALLSDAVTVIVRELAL
jgi:hypothetical protein